MSRDAEEEDKLAERHLLGRLVDALESAGSVQIPLGQIPVERAKPKAIDLEHALVNQYLVFSIRADGLEVDLHEFDDTADSEMERLTYGVARGLELTERTLSRRTSLQLARIATLRAVSVVARAESVMVAAAKVAVKGGGGSDDGEGHPLGSALSYRALYRRKQSVEISVATCQWGQFFGPGFEVTVRRRVRLGHRSDSDGGDERKKKKKQDPEGNQDGAAVGQFLASYRQGFPLANSGLEFEEPMAVGQSSLASSKECGIVELTWKTTGLDDEEEPDQPETARAATGQQAGTTSNRESSSKEKANNGNAGGDDADCDDEEEAEAWLDAEGPGPDERLWLNPASSPGIRVAGGNDVQALCWGDNEHSELAMPGRAAVPTPEVPHVFQRPPASPPWALPSSPCLLFAPPVTASS